MHICILNIYIPFRNQRYKESTALSKYIWKLKDQNKSYEIKWFIDMYAPSYHPTKKRCNLCNTEKTLILTSTHHHLLNQRSELTSTCRHRRKYYHRFSKMWSFFYMYLIICILQISAVFFLKENHCKEIFIIFFKKYAICDVKILEF